MPDAQVTNSQMKEMLSGEFQRSGDPDFQRRILVSTYQNIPGLKGFWGPSQSNLTGTPYITDYSFNGNHFPPQVTVPVMYTNLGRTYHQFTGANYMSLADATHWDILGNEAYINAKGISMGCWIISTRARPYAAVEGLISKWTTVGGQRSYFLELDNANNNNVTFVLSDNGANSYAFDHSKTILQNVAWYFVAATWNPAIVFGEAAGVRIWVNDQMEYHNTSDRGTVGFPLTIFNSTAPLRLSNSATGGQEYLGFATYWWIAGNYLQESQIFNLWEVSKNVTGWLNEKGTSW
ncbi:MAG: LamG domain-containing protein [Methanoregulaceae archaeon]|jgi:hypothetical protein|nr:LamG domain-containing protein [Methanoregulaceae archaeon]